MPQADMLSVAETPAPISKATMRGGLYLAGRYGLGVLVSVGNMLVLTWWIGPHAYGVFVSAIAIVAFLAVVARAGVDTYLVRCDAAPDEDTYATAAAIIFIFSAGLAVAAVAATPLLVRWYGSHEFVAPYLVLVAAVPLSGLTGVPMARLERALNFRRIAGIELASQSAGFLVSALLAWGKAGIWAPVAGQITWQFLTLMATAKAAAASPLRLRFNRDRAREMLAYGASLTASLRTWQLRTLVNPLLVSRFAGAEAVAYVALAIRIAEALGTFRLAAGRIAIAALARVQSRREDFRQALQLALRLQVITLGPLLCAFAWLGPWMVPRLVGMRWMPSLSVYPFIAAGVLVNSVYNLQASALFVVGKQWIVLRAYGAHVALLATATLCFLPRLGIVGYGWAELLACAAYFPIHCGLAQCVQMSYRKLTPWVAAFSAGLFLLPSVHLVNRILLR